MKSMYRNPTLEISCVSMDDICTASVLFAEEGFGDEIDFSDLT